MWHVRSFCVFEMTGPTLLLHCTQDLQFCPYTKAVKNIKFWAVLEAMGRLVYYNTAHEQSLFPFHLFPFLHFWLIL